MEIGAFCSQLQVRVREIYPDAKVIYENRGGSSIWGNIVTYLEKDNEDRTKTLVYQATHIEMPEALTLERLETETDRAISSLGEQIGGGNGQFN